MKIKSSIIIIDFIKAAWSLAKIESTKRKESSEKKSIAKAFNDRYTYRHVYVNLSERFDNFVKRGYAWMCPTCNKIHYPISCSGISGLQYPSCCNFDEGHRLECGIKGT